MIIRTLLLALILAVTSALTPALAQTGAASASQDSLLSQAGTALSDARDHALDLLSPRHFEKAQASYDEARSLIRKKSQEELVQIRLREALDEVAAAKQQASAARQKFSPVLDARTAALAAGADSLSKNLWRKADDRFRSAVRDYEKSPNAGGVKTDELAGAYRAAKLDALRTQILKNAQDKLDQLEHARGEKEVPTLILRAQQAMSRAEADVARDDVPAARTDAAQVVKQATHALSLLDYISKVRKAKQPWEAALLPYDDVLDSLAGYLGGSIDYARGIGVYSLPQLISLIKSRQDSLLNLTQHQEQQVNTLQSSLSDAQTRLTDAASRIAELQSRLGSITSPAGEAAGTERIARAQSVFHPGEAFVLQGQNGSVIIRIAGTLFSSGATKLTRTSQKIVDRVVDAVALFPHASIRVEGYTDSVGTAEKNQTISTERAQSVGEYLADKLKIPADQITVQGMGSSNPIDSNETAEGRARNRRVEVILTFPK
jgi:OOP family OmpA-OmpF porin